MPAAYPTALKVFQTFHDYTDIIWAISINECHDEILALESILGINPFRSTPYTTFGGAIADLYANKAPINHTHVHRNLLDDTQGNDHPQYIMVSGYPGFSHPVAGKAGNNPADLVPLSQMRSFGFVNGALVQDMVDDAVGNLMAGVWGGPPLAGAAASPNWHLTGGVASGCTDGGGRVTINFGASYPHCVQAVTCAKIPPQTPPGGFPCPPYNWIEAQVTLVAVSGTQAVFQFSHDYSWQAGQWVSLSWMAIGN
jgi:hypothetical protein